MQQPRIQPKPFQRCFKRTEFLVERRFRLLPLSALALVLRFVLSAAFLSAGVARQIVSPVQNGTDALGHVIDPAIPFGTPVLIAPAGVVFPSCEN